MTAPRDALEHALIERYQRGFPLVRRPYAAVASALGATEDEVMAALRRMTEAGKVSRVGAVIAPGLAGASTLAAIAVPPERLEEVAARVSADPRINHNYERENAINLWFVLHAPNEAQLEAALADVAATAGFPVLDLRLLREHHIDLGFSLTDGQAKTRHAPVAAQELEPADHALIATLDRGLAIDAQPFDRLAAASRVDVEDYLARLGRLVDKGVVRRFGLVLRHRAFGFDANAMVVWDVADEDADRLGDRLADQEGVTLCYRRRRALPDWPYNLYAMIHGRDRSAVERRIDAVARAVGLDRLPRAVLFSRRCFKQTGARREAA
jgi:DNA-binding Lrp family transcriptional regulator